MEQDTMVEVAVVDVLRQEVSDHYTIILAEKNGRRLLPIWIGPFEAESIAMRLLDKTPPRPMTYEFIANLLTATGVTVEDVCVSALRENTFYATVKLRNGEQVQEIDARPSDAIAVALRLDCPLFVAEDVMANSKMMVPEEHQKTPTGKGLTAIAAIIEERTQKNQHAMQEWKEKEAMEQKEEEQAKREKLLAALYGVEE